MPFSSSTASRREPRRRRRLCPGVVRYDVRRFRPLAARDGRRRSQRRPPGQGDGAAASMAASPPMSAACGDEAELAAALRRNLFGTARGRCGAARGVQRLCCGARRRRCAAQPVAALLAGAVAFGAAGGRDDRSRMQPSAPNSPGPIDARPPARPARAVCELAATPAERAALARRFDLLALDRLEAEVRADAARRRLAAALPPRFRPSSCRPAS